MPWYKRTPADWAANVSLRACSLTPAASAKTPAASARNPGKEASRV